MVMIYLTYPSQRNLDHQTLVFFVSHSLLLERTAHIPKLTFRKDVGLCLRTLYIAIIPELLAGSSRFNDKNEVLDL